MTLIDLHSVIYDTEKNSVTAVGGLKVRFSEKAVPISVYGNKVYRFIYDQLGSLVAPGDEELESLVLDSRHFDAASTLCTVFETFLNTGILSLYDKAKIDEKIAEFDLNDISIDNKLLSFYDDVALFLHAFTSWYDDPVAERGLMALVQLFLTLHGYVGAHKHDSKAPKWLPNNVDDEKQQLESIISNEKGSGSSPQRMENPNRKQKG